MSCFLRVALECRQMTKALQDSLEARGLYVGEPIAVPEDKGVKGVMTLDDIDYYLDIIRDNARSKFIMSS